MSPQKSPQVLAALLVFAVEWAREFPRDLPGVKCAEYFQLDTAEYFKLDEGAKVPELAGSEGWGIMAEYGSWGGVAEGEGGGGGWQGGIWAGCGVKAWEDEEGEDDGEDEERPCGEWFWE